MECRTETLSLAREKSIIINISHRSDVVNLNAEQCDETSGAWLGSRKENNNKDVINYSG